MIMIMRATDAKLTNGWLTGRLRLAEWICAYSLPSYYWIWCEYSLPSVLERCEMQSEDPDARYLDCECNCCRKVISNQYEPPIYRHVVMMHLGKTQVSPMSTFNFIPRRRLTKKNSMTRIMCLGGLYRWNSGFIALPTLLLKHWRLPLYEVIRLTIKTKRIFSRSATFEYHLNETQCDVRNLWSQQKGAIRKYTSFSSHFDPSFVSSIRIQATTLYLWISSDNSSNVSKAWTCGNEGCSCLRKWGQKRHLQT